MLDTFLDQQNSEHTAGAYRRALAVFSGYLGKPIEDATTADVVGWKKALAESGKAAGTQTTYWTGVRSYFGWLEKSSGKSSPFGAVKAPRGLRNQQPRIPSDDSFEAVVHAFDNSPDKHDLRDKAIICLMANGLRVGEITDLNTEDAWLDSTGNLLVRVTGKGLRQRIVPLSRTAASALSDWIRVRNAGGEGEYMFPDYVSGERATHRQIQVVSLRASRKARLAKPVNPHSLRHHYATRLVRLGVNVFTVQKLLGHENIRTTQVYVDLDMSDMIQASGIDTF